MTKNERNKDHQNVYRQRWKISSYKISFCSNKATLFLVGFHCTDLKLKTFFQTLNKKKATQKIIN